MLSHRLLAFEIMAMSCLMHVMQGCFPVVVSNSAWDVRASNIQPMRCVTASQASAIRRVCQKPQSPRHPLHIFFPCFCFFSTVIFFLLRRGSRIEVEDLMWDADKVTTILSNASSDRIHVRTLIGIAQLFYDFGETVAPTNLLLLGLPWSIACAEIF